MKTPPRRANAKTSSFGPKTDAQGKHGTSASLRQGSSAMTLDWTGYLDLLLARVNEIAALSPDTVRGYRDMMVAGEHTRHLDPKTRDLIALACSVIAKCDGCITVHANAAAKHGATREEVAEALGVAVGVGAGSALVGSMRVLEAFDTHREGVALPASSPVR
jgi:AhpD family alkylhydroperoxidase